MSASHTADDSFGREVRSAIHRNRNRHVARHVARRQSGGTCNCGAQPNNCPAGPAGAPGAGGEPGHPGERGKVVRFNLKQIYVFPSHFLERGRILVKVGRMLEKLLVKMF